jgi:REP element-mobilizing transposase RayT
LTIQVDNQLASELVNLAQLNSATVEEFAGKSLNAWLRMRSKGFDDLRAMLDEPEGAPENPESERTRFIAIFPSHQYQHLYTLLIRQSDVGRDRLGARIKELVGQCDCAYTDCAFAPNHIHFTISIPPKQAVSPVIARIKHESAIFIARLFEEQGESIPANSFWAPGFFLSAVCSKRHSTQVRSPQSIAR